MMCYYLNVHFQGLRVNFGFSEVLTEPQNVVHSLHYCVKNGV